VEPGTLVTAEVPADPDTSISTRTKVLVDGEPLGETDGTAGSSFTLTGGGCPSP